ncbi:MAG: hypothetical protein ACYDD1_17095 [Caulobacteraceae bacterium]
MSDATTASGATATPAATAAPTEVSVSDIAAHYAAVIASATAHVALINSKTALYPGGLPAVLDNMARQTTFLSQKVAAAAPVVASS